MKRIHLTRAVQIAITALLLQPTVTFAWAEHYLMTSRSLEQPDLHFLKEKIKVSSLADFIRSNRSQLQTVFNRYYHWLEQEQGRDVPARYRDRAFSLDADVNDEQAVVQFLKAARLNPKARFALINRLMPGEPPRYRPVNAAEVAPSLPVSPFYDTRFEDVSGQMVSARSILITFSDEPDWHFDQELFKVKDYGYGAIPFGQPDGVSSRAPFHMQFAHEPWYVGLAVPGVDRGMLHDRVELFLRLAAMARNSNELYWSYRFAAWSIHYMQDICQPFHARLLPSAGIGDFLQYTFSWDKKAYRTEVTRKLLNHHFAYEGFVTLVLRNSYSPGSATARRLAATLRFNRNLVYSQNTGELVRAYMQWSADAAPEIYRVVHSRWGERLNRPGFDLLHRQHELEKDVQTLQFENDELVRFTRSNFNRAGAATRNILKLVSAETFPVTSQR